ncbi:MAG: hypothetical protein LLG15_01495 [Betaproteobacteria bacterium]|nr:hypothetical protein [Betaproteobacteria bacterium]
MSRHKIHENAAARVRAHRERHGLKSFTVELPAETYAGLMGYLQHRGESKTAVIVRLIQTQLLRKR